MLAVRSPTPSASQEQPMPIPTEPIGSIPRPPELIDAVAALGGNADHPSLEPLFVAAIRATVARFEATGSPVITDGEQRKYHNFWDYCVHGLPNIAPDGFNIRSRGHSGGCAADHRAVPLQGVRRPLLEVAQRLHHGGQAGVESRRRRSACCIGRGPRRLLARAVSSRTCSPSTSARSGAAFTRARTRCRSTSRGALHDQGRSHRRPARQLHRLNNLASPG